MTVKETDKSDEDKRDETHSWNGFSYQGKITIITVLNIINAYNSDSSQNLEERIEALKKHFANWKLEIERKEDFAILEANAYQSIHQVKANKSTAFSTYEAAITRLKDHKVSENPKLYLHLSTKVDWPQDSYQQELIGINFYQYTCPEDSNNKLSYCDLKCTKLQLEEAVQKFLQQYLIKDSGDEAVWFHARQLESIICEHINERHIKKQKTKQKEQHVEDKDDIKYTIDFVEFIDGLLKDSEVFNKYRFINETN